MTEARTPLDAAAQAVAAAPDDDAARLRLCERLADAELFVLLEREAAGGRIDPQIFETGAGRYLAAFDGEDRLAAFAGAGAPYAALPGRVLARMLAAADIGIAVNLEVPEGEALVDAATVAWMAETLDTQPRAAEARIARIAPPAGLPEALLSALDAKFATMSGRARAAYLATAIHEDGTRGPLLAFVNAAPGAEGALSSAVSETLAFSGLADAALDVTFATEGDAFAERLARVGLRFDLPQPSAPARRTAPGSDPDAPPRLN